MISKWYKLKSQAIAMRKKGDSIRHIEAKLKIPKSTLSGWLRLVVLNKKAKGILYTRWKQRLVATRKLAVAWHNLQKSNRLKQAESEAKNIIDKINSKDPLLLELTLAILYLGEGFKTSDTGMGNSDPMILKFLSLFCLKIINYQFLNLSASFI